MASEANFVELRYGEVQDSPAPTGQDRRREDAHIVGYYALAAGTGAKEGLGHWWGKAKVALVEDDPVPQYNAANNTSIIKAGAP
jgi:hypothetical protein